MRRQLENDLYEWKVSKDRKPLIINGARQVGKTYIIREFGERYYKNVVYINFESNLAVASYFNDNINPERLIRFLESYVNEAIIPESTLIIFDEIQSCERALTSLKYFYEETPEYHVISAGSLLGVAINREKYSFPVGKVDTLTLYPLDFEEFLWANGEERLCECIYSCYETIKPMQEALHQKAIDLYRNYLIIGGMPAAVNEYVNTKKLIMVPNVQNKILDDYLADMSKYASNTESVKIRSCYQSIPAQLAKENKKFQYKIVQRGGTAGIFGASIDWLNFAGIVLKCQKTEHGMDPISVYADLTSFKLYMGDVGLLTAKTGISQHVILNGENNYFMGAIAENYVAQALTAKGHNLYYWSSGNSAELDFLLQKNGEITAIEVKYDTNTKSKSMSEFLKRYKPDKAYKVSLKNFGKADNFVAIPLYAMFCI
ncbi:MAG: AAA family ATPase [Herbinix sp.]|nr:AAA family ATPase [Herbinix sp.]